MTNLYALWAIERSAGNRLPGDTFTATEAEEAILIASGAARVADAADIALADAKGRNFTVEPEVEAPAPKKAVVVPKKAPAMAPTASTDGVIL